MKKLKMLLVFVLFAFVSTVAMADIFFEKDALKVGAGIETTKSASGVVSLEYGLTLDKVLLFDPDNVPEIPESDRRAIVKDPETGKSYLTNLEVGIGVQTRIMNELYNHQAYYGTVGYTFNIEHDYDYLPHAIRPLVRVGFATDLDGKGGGFYAGGGAEFYFTEDWYATVLFESEDKEYRNTFGVGYKLDRLPFMQ